MGERREKLCSLLSHSQFCINSSKQHAVDVFRQIPSFYANANMLLQNYRYRTDEVKCKLFSTSTRKLKTSYNGVLRHLVLIVKPYMASEMFVTHTINPCF